MKINILFSIFIWASINATSQRLSLNQLVNTVYSNKVDLGADSLLYIMSDCSPFFQIKSEKKDSIKLVVFKNKELLIKDLSLNNSYLLQVNLSDVLSDRLILIIGVYEINKEIFSEKSNYLIFYDEREIECKLNRNREWVYHKTISIKKHLTN